LALAIQALNQLAKPAEEWPRLFRCFEERGQGHQTTEIQMTGGVECFYDCWKLSLIGAGLCRLVREINLDKHIGSSIQLAGDSIEPFSQLNAVDRMNNIKRLDCLPSLIRLKMTD